MTEQWRYACPECGCVSVFNLVESDGYRCNECYATGFDPVDLKEHDTGPTESYSDTRFICDGGTPTEYGWCDHCERRREFVPVAGGDALVCCRCDSIPGGESP